MKKPVMVGCGNMGSAMIEALLQEKRYQPQDITIVEKQPNPFVEQLAEKGATVFGDLAELQDPAAFVVLAVKPQGCVPVLQAVSSKLASESLVMSIMAGISIAQMAEHLQAVQIIRCMPNTPCSVQQGMTVFCGNEAVSEESFALAQQVLEAMGRAFRVNEESMIDAATAISGSGPAYVFFLAEALKEGAAELGFNEEQSDILARQTLLGASILLDRSDEAPEELRRRVTSPGGTTEAALTYFSTQNLKDLLKNGFKASYQRSLELGRRSQ